MCQHVTFSTFRLNQEVSDLQSSGTKPLLSSIQTFFKLINTQLRYVAVLSVSLYMFTNFYRLDSHNKACVTLANSQ